MIRVVSDFSDSRAFSQAAKRILLRGILSMFENVELKYTIRERVEVDGNSARIHAEKREFGQDSMTGYLAFLSFKAVLLARMDFSWTGNVNLEVSDFDDPIFFSRFQENREKMLGATKDLVLSFRAGRMAAREFPDEFFRFSLDEMGRKGGVFHEIMKHIYARCFRGVDEYNYEYLKEMVSGEWWDVVYFLEECKTGEDFSSWAKELIKRTIVVYGK